MYEFRNYNGKTLSYAEERSLARQWDADGRQWQSSPREAETQYYLFNQAAGSSQIYYCTQVWLEERTAVMRPVIYGPSLPSDHNPIDPLEIATRRSKTTSICISSYLTKITVRDKRINFSSSHNTPLPLLFSLIWQSSLSYEQL